MISILQALKGEKRFSLFPRNPLLVTALPNFILYGLCLSVSSECFLKVLLMCSARPYMDT